MQANTETLSHMVQGIFSHALGRALDALGEWERLVLAQQGREDEQAGRSSGPQELRERGHGASRPMLPSEAAPSCRLLRWPGMQWCQQPLQTALHHSHPAPRLGFSHGWKKPSGH